MTLRKISKLATLRRYRQPCMLGSTNATNVSGITCRMSRAEVRNLEYEIAKIEYCKGEGGDIDVGRSVASATAGLPPIWRIRVY